APVVLEEQRVRGLAVIAGGRDLELARVAAGGRDAVVRADGRQAEQELRELLGQHVLRRRVVGAREVASEEVAAGAVRRGGDVPAAIAQLVAAAQAVAAAQPAERRRERDVVERAVEAGTPVGTLRAE